MRGYLVTADEEQTGDMPNLTEWETLVVDAVGNVIEFWGFKRNQGRVWALLYLRGKAMSALEIQETLALSKGAVSMITRELERWGVINRVRTRASQSWHFVAETDLMDMIGRVVKEREQGVVSRVHSDLSDAEQKAKSDAEVAPEVLDRVVRMRQLAQLMSHAIDLFVNTANIDMKQMMHVLDGAAAFAANRPPSPTSPTSAASSADGAATISPKE